MSVPTDTSHPARRIRTRTQYRRSHLRLNATLGMICRFVWSGSRDPGDHFWSIPADPRRDFDCILADAICELRDRRNAMAAAGMKSPWGDLEADDA